MKILSKYITRQAVITLFFTMGVFTFVLLLARILKQLSDMLVNQKVGLDIVGYFVLLVTPNILSFSLPMAMLATALLVFGRMSADNEITAMRSCGVSLGQVVAPVILLAAVMSVPAARRRCEMPACVRASRMRLPMAGSCSVHFRLVLNSPPARA